MRKAIVPALILAAGGIPLALMWSGEVDHAQGRILKTIIVAGLTVIALLVWLAFFAPFARRVRWGVAGGIAAAIAAFFAAFRIEGASGDLVPSLTLRWRDRPGSKAAPVVTAAGAPTDPAPQAHFAQFLGPRRNGTVELSLDPDWTLRPPRVLWRREVGAGWSGFAVLGGRAVTQEQQGEEEAVVAYDLRTGRPLWRHADPVRYDTTLGGVGPRATPTLEGGRCWTMGATGILNALDLATGRRLWSVDVVKDTGAPMPEWGFAGSPLREGAAVIVAAGASLVAYDASTGARLWSGGSERASYASPFVAELAGRRQVVQLNLGTCTGHDPSTGALLWRFEWRGRDPKAAQPVLLGGDRIVISAGYGVGADAFRVTRTEAVPLWSSMALKAKFANFVERDGRLYGLDDGRLVCVDASTGDRVWGGARTGHGQLLLVGSYLLVSTEKGELVLVDADPAAFRERARLPVLAGKTWNSPALAGPWLLLRNDREAACLELPVLPGPNPR